MFPVCKQKQTSSLQSQLLPAIFSSLKPTMFPAAQGSESLPSSHHHQSMAAMSIRGSSWCCIISNVAPSSPHHHRPPRLEIFCNNASSPQQGCETTDHRIPTGSALLSRYVNISQHPWYFWNLFLAAHGNFYGSDQRPDTRTLSQASTAVTSLRTIVHPALFCERIVDYLSSGVAFPTKLNFP